MLKTATGFSIYRFDATRRICPQHEFQVEDNLSPCCLHKVKVLAERHGMDYDALEKWYDGYQIGSEMSMFNPNSVMEAISNEWCETLYFSAMFV